MFFSDRLLVYLISTHSAREDGDTIPQRMQRIIRIFQPTPPARTETAKPDEKQRDILNFNPLRPRGRRLSGFLPVFFDTAQISTHSAREDGDGAHWNCRKHDTNFNPLRPRGRRQHPYAAHAQGHGNFNPLRPRGRRQQYYTKKPTILHHISTIKSHHTPSNHRQPTLHTSKAVFTVQFFRCESPRKFMFASGSHQTI